MSDAEATPVDPERLRPELPEVDRPAVEDFFLGASVCQTPPLNLTDIQPPTSSLYVNGATAQDVPLDIPFPSAALAPSESTVETQWRRDDNGLYVYSRPRRFAPLPSLAGSIPSQGLSLEGRPMGYPSQGLHRAGMQRREEIYRLSQNPWGPNTVFGPRSLPAEMSSRQIRHGTPTTDEGRYQLGRPEEYGKDGDRHGVMHRVRNGIVDVGGRLCQNFLVWVFFVAAFAGIEGMKSRPEKKNIEWSDSEEENEAEKFDVLFFKG